MKITNRIAIAAISSTALMISAAAANATALIQGVVFFENGTAVTEYSEPNSQVQFSFDVPEPLDANPTADITGFSYELNGHGVTTIVNGVEFYTIANHGMFDIVFPTYRLSIYGADIGSTGTVGPAGFYDVTAAGNDGNATGSGGVTVNAAAGIPEPATWTIMMAGFGGMGLVMRSRRRRVAAAA